MFNLAKKKIYAMIIFMLVFSFFIVGIVCCFNTKHFSASAEQIHNNEQIFMEKAIYEAVLEEGFICDNLLYIKDDIYFSDETKGGYLIEFFGGDCIGYAIFFKIYNELKLVELNFNGHSPYYNKDGIYIYPSLGCYYLKINNLYYDALTMEPLNDYFPTKFPEFYASCNSDKKLRVPVSREINYNYGTLIQDEILDFYVEYDSGDKLYSKKSNNCANIAGLVMLNYWNKKYNNNLLNLNQKYLSGRNIGYEKKEELLNIFYDYMNTNWFLGISGGTLPNDCYNGFEKLIKEYGYNVSRDKDLSYDEMVSYINKGIPIFIVSTDYYFSSNSTTTKLPTVSSTAGDYNLFISYERSYGIANSHTFVGYGYAYYDLYDSNGNNFKEQLIKVANGWGGCCYFNYSISNKYSSAAINVFKW